VTRALRAAALHLLGIAPALDELRLRVARLEAGQPDRRDLDDLRARVAELYVDHAHRG
jgi:hypothetical protein